MSSQFACSEPIAALDPRVVELLCGTLRRSHYLSKQLRGSLQDEEYKNRADLVSILILSGYARPNGISVNGTVGLDIAAERPYQTHQPLRRLHPEAQARLKAQLAEVSVKCSLLEHLTAKRRKPN
jgi:hypothetical protein